MGRYINQLPDGTQLPALGKADKLLSIQGALEIPPPTEWRDNLVCVVNNFAFDAAAYAYSKEEMEEFLRPTGRRTRWLIVPEADKLAK